MVALAAVLVIGAGMCVRLAAEGGAVSGDSVRLTDGVAALDACLHLHRQPCPETQQWPLLQYIPSLAVKRLGGARNNALDLLVVLSVAGVLGTLAMLWRAGTRTRLPGAAELALLAGLAGPLAWYAQSTFGEGIATFLTTLFVGAVLWRWHPLVVLTALVGAGISKETSLPFLLALGLLASRVGEPGARVAANRKAMLAGAVLVVALLVGFNMYRYGVPYNRFYSDPDFVATGIGRRLDWFAAYFVAPDAGFAFMWPGALVLFVVAVAATSTRARKQQLLALAIVCLLVGTFSSWWSPFGWTAWGARFSTPWVPSLALLALAMVDRRESWTRVLHSRRFVLAAGALVLVLGVAQLGAGLHPVDVVTAPASADSPCASYPQHPETQIRSGDRQAASINAACIHDRAWTGYSLRSAYSGIEGRDWLWALIYAIAAAGLLGAAATARAVRPSRPLGSLSP